MMTIASSRHNVSDVLLMLRDAPTSSREACPKGNDHDHALHSSIHLHLSPFKMPVDLAKLEEHLSKRSYIEGWVSISISSFVGYFATPASRDEIFIGPCFQARRLDTAAQNMPKIPFQYF